MFFFSFLSLCCYTKIHAIFFIHSHDHPHHFQLNEVVPRVSHIMPALISALNAPFEKKALKKH